MVELPSVPSLDVSDPVDEMIPIIEEAAPAPVAAPVPVPVSAPAPKAAPVGSAPTRPTAIVAESVDEILEQATEQMLKLGHLEELIGGVAAQHEDLREELHAGISELRALLEQGAASAARASHSEASTSAFAERLDQLEVQGNSLKSRNVLVVALLLLQLVVLGWLATRVVGASSGQLGGGGSASYLSAPPQADGVASIPGSAPPPEGAATAPAEPADPKASKKKKRRRRP